MTSLSFRVVIDQSQLQRLSSNGYSLCLSNTVNESNNVVTLALPATGDNAYSTNNSFSWTANYSMAASQKAWVATGVKVEVASTVKDVPLKEGYRLQSWGTAPTVFPHGVDLALRFEVVENDAAPVVYLDQINSFNGKTKMSFANPTPIYIAPHLVLKPGGATLTPKRAAMVYFKQEIETSGMISVTDMFLPRAIDLTERPTGQILTLDADGRWSVA